MRFLITIPAYNEEQIIEENLLKIKKFVEQIKTNHDFVIALADNNSADMTGQIGQKLQQEHKIIDYHFIPQQGKGVAVMSVWQKLIDQHDHFIFMDADLATDLEALPVLIKNLEEGHDLVIGSRYLSQSKVNRSVVRKLFSFVYRLFLKVFLKTKIKDFPCGFKAVNKKVVAQIVPQIKNQTWFFDTEMVYLAEKNGLKIKEIPVNWQEPRTAENKSRVNLFKVSKQYLKEVIRLKLGG